MKFLVILVCVTANYFWRRDYDRIKDTWFYSLRQGIDKITSNLVNPDGIAWVIGLLAIFLIPMAGLLAILVLIENWLFGLVSLFVHVLILLMAFDRIHPGSLAQGYLLHWREGDIEGAFRYLEQELSCTTMPLPTEFAGLHGTFCKLYVYRCFEKMFVMFFWYMLAGPLGVMFAYVCYQQRDGEMTLQRSKEANVIALLIEILEWAPLRLLGLTLSLTGDFEACSDRLRNTWLRSDIATNQTVYEYSMCALGLKPLNNSDHKTDITEESEIKSFREKAALEVYALQALMERNQIIWLCLIALFTILGLGL